MRGETFQRRAALVTVGLGLALGGSTLRAQGPGLGGYGGSMGQIEAGMATPGPAIPYAGRFGGFMPYRMGGGSLSFAPRAGASMASPRAPFALNPGSGGMSAGMGAGGRGLPSFAPGGLRGMGGGMAPLSGARGGGVMPPSFAYPFRQPPSLVAPAGPGAGMSM